MAYELREGTANAFLNKYKKSDKQPKWKADALIGGDKYTIAIWEKEGPKGPYLGLKISPFDAKEAMYQKESDAANKVAEDYYSQKKVDDSDIPF